MHLRPDPSAESAALQLLARLDEGDGESADPEAFQAGLDREPTGSRTLARPNTRMSSRHAAGGTEDSRTS